MIDDDDDDDIYYYFGVSSDGELVFGSGVTRHGRQLLRLLP